MDKERVNTFLTRDEVDFLDKLGKDALFSSGSKISRAKILEWLVEMIKGLDIKAENIKNEQDLLERVREAIKQIEAQENKS